jgi:hypothetical protein
VTSKASELLRLAYVSYLVRFFSCFDPDLRKIPTVRNIFFRSRQDNGWRLTLAVDPTSTAVFETNFLEPKIVGVSGYCDALGEGN